MPKYLFLLFLFMTFPTRADVPPEQVKEVEHLLNFVKDSNCTINRNGSDYNGEKGFSHINRKYNYFRDDIKNTEDFIKYSATKSTMSGDFYTVSCPGKKTVQTKDWLLNELVRFRSTQK
ncbi:MAG: DUF5329 family protein [Acidiferrobacterales bacterium]